MKIGFRSVLHERDQQEAQMQTWTLRILGISAVWYNKPFPTFLSVIALARPHLWLTSEGFSRSLVEPDTWKVPAALYHQLIHS